MAKGKKSVEEMPKKEPRLTKEKVRSLITPKNVILGVFAFLFIVQYFQIQSAFGTFSFLQGRDSSLITEIGQIKEAYVSVGNDLKEVREFLRMPTNDYLTLGENIGEDEEGKNKNELELALFKYVDYLATNKDVQKNLTTNKGLLTNLKASPKFQDFTKAQALTVSDLGEDAAGISLVIKDSDGADMVTYYLDKEDGVLYFKTIKEKTAVKESEQVAFETELTAFISKNKDSLVKARRDLEAKKAQIVTAMNAADTKKTAEELKITLDTAPDEENMKVVYSIYNVANDLVGEVVLNMESLKINLVDKNNPDFSLEVSEMTKSFVPFLTKLDTKTGTEKKVAVMLKSLQNTINDKGFQVLMEQNGFKISEKYREDAQRYYYDISDKNGNNISAIAIEKTTGVINIVQPDGTNSENLLFFDPEYKKKTLKIPDKVPTYSKELSHEKDTMNILIAGKHGSLLDTMIFAHIDEKNKDIKMISIPRDLQYNGRKINSLAFYYGLPELTKVLSNMTGYQVDKYIVIDMYSFIDVVDLIGGVDVHLNKAVVDPTYKVIDNGIASTLHYEPGDYHLSGKQALRLARTRHTSSDFARAERQQMILKSLQDKAQNFGFGDSETIYEIAKTVLAKTETDISLEDALVYYFRYQNYEIKSNDVISSGNILYSPPYVSSEECAAIVAGGGGTNCQGENHAYILIPRDENWDLIKWFFKEKFEA